MTPDRQALVGLADQILRARSSPERLASIEASDDRADGQLWAELASAGLVGIAVPETYGGAGLGLAELCLLLEQQGRRLALVPLWETVVAALAVARYGSDEQTMRWLPGVAAGTTRLTLAVDLGAPDGISTADGRLTGSVRVVRSGAVAEAAVIAVGEQVWLAELGAARRSAVQTTTHGLAADLFFDRAPAQRLGADATWLRDVARVGLAAVQLGNTEEGIREAAAYVSAREQFGRPLATFQAVSQQLADGYCDVQAMRATLWQAVWALEQGGKARREVDVAGWWAADAGVRVTTTIQHLHGGLGADTTYPVHRRLLWALETDALLGGASRQLARLGTALV